MARPIRTVAAVVAEIDEPAPGIRRISLSDEDGWELPPFREGAHIDIHLPNRLVRTYSLCNPPEDNCRYQLAIKREIGGRGGSEYIHSSLEVGMKVGVSLPRGGIETSRENMNIFVAGGIGVTAFLSAIANLEGRCQSNYEFHWACRGEPPLIDMVRASMLSGRVRLYDTTSGSKPDIAAIIRPHGDNAHAFCCGPQGMIDAFEQAVVSWPEERKHVERFVAQKLETSSNAVPYTVVLARSMQEAVVDPALGLVATLEHLGADVSVSCGGGICGACRTGWIEGQPVHRDRVLSPGERQKEVIICVAECASPRLVLDL